MNVPLSEGADAPSVTRRARGATLARYVAGTLDFDTVTARGLVKAYGPTRALAGVDLTLSPGRVTVLEGPNGSGKSTLLGLLALLVRPTRGSIHRQARRSAGDRRAARAAHAAMVYPTSGRESSALRRAARHARRTRGSPTARRFEIGAFVDRPAPPLRG